MSLTNLGDPVSTSFGFNGTWNNGSNPVPSDFTLNGTTCTGSVTTTTPPTGTLPSSFRWSSSGVLISPQSNATHDLIAVKDPSVVYYGGRWYVYMSTVNSAGNHGMAATSFTDWSQANSAPLYYLDQTPIGGGYKTAPMLFYCAPQKLWYLTYQTGGNIGDAQLLRRTTSTATACPRSSPRTSARRTSPSAARRGPRTSAAARPSGPATTRTSPSIRASCDTCTRAVIPRPTTCCPGGSACPPRPTPPVRPFPAVRQGRVLRLTSRRGPAGAAYGRRHRRHTEAIGPATTKAGVTG